MGTRGDMPTMKKGGLSIPAASAPMLSDSTNSAMSPSVRRVTKIFMVDTSTQERINLILHSRLHYIFVLVFSLALLFGAQVRDLAFENGCRDSEFKVLFIITLSYLLLDTFLNAMVDTAYGLIPPEQSYLSNQKRRMSSCDAFMKRWFCCYGFDIRKWRLGTFLFWCDVVSAISLLYYVFEWDSYSKSHTITVKNDGSFDGFYSDYYGYKFFEPDIGVVLVIIRAARLGKFIKYVGPQRYADFKELKARFVRLFCLPYCCRELIEEKGHAKVIEETYLKYRLQKKVKSERRSPRRTLKRNSSRRQSSKRSVKNERSQVGQAMLEITAQRLHVTIIVTLMITAVLTSRDKHSSSILTMVVLHEQPEEIKPYSVEKAMNLTQDEGSELFKYIDENNEINAKNSNMYESLSKREELIISVKGNDQKETKGWFSIQRQVRASAKGQILATVLTIFIWIVFSLLFSDPVMSLVATPIERMVRLLGMLTRDPLGYQSSLKFKLFQSEEENIGKKSGFSKIALEGMETTFLTTTIHRIGSLMKVGFGSAGVEIIKDVLTKDERKNVDLSQAGTKVNCIFVFCDIRQFTDATEALQEEVFVFTNQIASVVHSICVAHGGSPNKNIGDAFLLSWNLDVKQSSKKYTSFGWDKAFTAKNCEQYDKALLSVAKTVIELYDDEFYLEGMSSKRQDKLKEKLGKRKGPLVQLGFGLNAGFAVQGAIGSLKKIDATYISVDVDLSETLEGLTKRYGVSILMSHKFYRELSQTCRQDVRLIDRLKIETADEEFENDDPYPDEENELEVYTYDIEVEALYRPKDLKPGETEDDMSIGSKGSKPFGFRQSVALRRQQRTNSKTGMSLPNARRRGSLKFFKQESDKQVEQSNEGDEVYDRRRRKKKLPTEEIKYSVSDWKKGEIRKVREKFADGVFLDKFNDGLTAYQKGDWQTADRCFVELIDKYDDGPSKYFQKIILKHQRMVPKGFIGYGTV